MCAARHRSLFAGPPLFAGQGSKQRRQPGIARRSPAAAADRERLPSKRVKRDGKQYGQLDKRAFVYDEPEDCYWCPQGQRLPYAGTTRAQKRNRVRERRRDQSSPDDCTKCPLLAMCVQSQAESRTINREQHETLRESHAVKMATDEAQEKYSRRRHPGARPFAVIEQHFGARRFLLRGLDRVKQEWHWLASAFNLDRLFGLMRGGTGPPGVPA